MADESVQVRALRPGGVEPCLASGIEVVRMGEEPPGDLAGFGGVTD